MAARSRWRSPSPRASSIRPSRRCSSTSSLRAARASSSRSRRSSGPRLPPPPSLLSSSPSSAVSTRASCPPTRPSGCADARSPRCRRHSRDPPASRPRGAGRRRRHARARRSSLPAPDPARDRLRRAVGAELPQVPLRARRSRIARRPQRQGARRQPPLLRRLHDARLLQGQGEGRGHEQARRLPPDDSGGRRADAARLPEAAGGGPAPARQALPRRRGHPARPGGRAGSAPRRVDLRRPHPHPAPQLSRRSLARTRHRLHERGHAGRDREQPERQRRLRLPPRPVDRARRPREALGARASRQGRQGEHRRRRQGPAPRQGDRRAAHPRGRAAHRGDPRQQSRPLARRAPAGSGRHRLPRPRRSGGGDGGEDGVHPRSRLPPVVRPEPDVDAHQPRAAFQADERSAEADAEPGDDGELPPRIDLQGGHLARRPGEGRHQPQLEHVLRRRLHDGTQTLGNHRWRCDKPTGHGALNVVSALKYSCDVFYYSAGDHAGIDAISDMAHRLGYGQPTGLDLGREITGIIPSSSTINPATGSLRAHAINASIGQGEINVTPLQQAVAYAAIANGGTVWKPQITQGVESPDGKVLREFKPEPDVNNGHEGKLGVKPEYLAAVRAGLVAVVNEPGGTGYRSRLPHLKLAGSSGTAQVVKLGQKQNLKTDAQQYFSRDHAWFASFAPAEDPEIVVIVLNEHGGWGAEAAAPVASKIIKAWSDIKKQDEAKSMARAEQ